MNRNSYLARGHVTDGTVCLDRLQLVQTPIQFFQGFHCQSGVCFIFRGKRGGKKIELNSNIKSIGIKDLLNNTDSIAYKCVYI